MSEAELRDGLRAAVRDEPPLDFDADALIQRGQVARKRRRALVAVGVATAVLTGSVVSLPLLSRDAGQVDALTAGVLTTEAAGPSSATTGSAVTPSVTAGAPSAVLAGTDHLAEYAVKRFRQLVPQVSDVRAEFSVNKAKDVEGYVTGVVYFVDREGSSGVTVVLSGPPLAVTRDQFCDSAKCEPSRQQPDGSHLEFATAGGRSNMITRSAAHFRTDGTVVQVNGYNYDPMQGGKIRDAVPVTADQLVSLATDPNLSLGE
ncbi:hypothetical protein [Saccharothrix obliqua]|uniref:hypothetical protein n=1 Tax=Saccharothrix obliqua TaxID=2861747 RepID=UPI001C5FCDD3|nr:hypothetical protein [Saccharothrix obliqua]MBW4715672.1 hypothetical protein [Saccharothrix obliqua]